MFTPIGNSSVFRRAGFTLVELLVAVGIFIVLTTITIATVNLNIGSERVSAASRQVQAMLEGAKSRAFKMKKPVGVRFLPDPYFENITPSETRELGSMVYVSTPDANNPEGHLRVLGDVRNVEWVSGDFDWETLKQRFFLEAETKIRLYNMNVNGTKGTYIGEYRVNFFPGINQIQFLTSINGVVPNQPGLLWYEIDLSKVLVPLAGEEPVQLPSGTVIDLESCRRNGTAAYNIPQNWRSPPSISVNREIVFTPQGVVHGPLSALGVVHLTIAETRDTRVVCEHNNTPYGSNGIPAWDLRDRVGSDGQGPDHIGSFRVVTVFTANGGIGTSQLDQAPGSTPGEAANIFNFALQGISSN